MSEIDKSVDWVDDNPDTINLVSSAFSALRLTLMYKPIVVNNTDNKKEYRTHTEFITVSNNKSNLSIRLTPNINYKLTLIDEKDRKVRKDIYFPVGYIQAIRNIFYEMYFACLNNVFGRMSTIADNNRTAYVDDNGETQYMSQESTATINYKNTSMKFTTALDRVTFKSIDTDEKGDEYNIVINSISVAEFLNFCTFLFDLNPYDAVLQMMNYVGGSPHPGNNRIDLRPSYNDAVLPTDEANDTVNKEEDKSAMQNSMMYKRDDYGLETMKREEAKPTITRIKW